MIANAVCNTYIELGANAYNHGDDSMGDTMLDAALQEAQRLACTKHEPGPLFHKLARVYYQQNKISKAEAVYEQAVALYDRMFEPDESSFSLILFNLAELYFSQQKYEQALPLYARSIIMAERVHGRNNLILERRLLKFAWISSHLKHLEQADEAYSRVTQLRHANKRARVDALESRFVSAW